MRASGVVKRQSMVDCLTFRLCIQGVTKRINDSLSGMRWSTGEQVQVQVQVQGQGQGLCDIDGDRFASDELLVDLNELGNTVARVCMYGTPAV